MQTQIEIQSALVLLLLSIDGTGATRLPQLLSKAGFRVILLAPGRMAAHRSRYVSEHMYAPNSPANVISVAKEIVGAKPKEYDFVLFGDEPVLWAAVDDPGVLADRLPFPNTPDLVEVLTSKNRFLVESRAHGLTVPRFEISNDVNEVPAIAERVGFPLVVKRTRGLAGSGLIFAVDRASLEAQINYQDEDMSFAVQEAIPGPCGSTSVLYDHGRPVCWFSYFMRRTWPNRFASACVAEIYDHADVELLARGIGEITTFDGLGGIDWIQDERTGRLVMLEFNPRPTPVYHLGPHAGVDFARAIADWRSGTASSQRPERNGKWVQLFPQNLYRATDDRDGIEFLRSFGDAPWGDPALMLAHLRRFATHYLPQNVRQKVKNLLSQPAQL